jgi:hypothetical protein
MTFDKISLATIKKTKPFILITSILILTTIVSGAIWWFNSKEKKSESHIKTEITEDTILFEGQPSAVFQLGETGKLGLLEINATDKKESSYLSFELDQNNQRIIKKYLAIQIKVFNPSNTQVEYLLIGLMDDQGNTYKPDYNVRFFVRGLKDFGKNMTIYPRIIQEGYIFFTNINENARELQLIFAASSTQEKIAFKVER